MSYTIIGQKGCRWCEKAVNLLEAKFIRYDYFSLDSCKWLIPLMKESGNTTVPLIFYEGIIIGGYTELEALLKDKESKT